MAGNGDIIPVTNDWGNSRNSNDIIVSNYSDVLIADNLNNSVWKGDYYPSVYYFPIGKQMLLREYRNNNIMLIALDELLRSRLTVQDLDTIEIMGACSPSGGEVYNMKLALSRCMALRSYLRWKHLDLAERFPIKFTVIGIDWVGYGILKDVKPSLSEKEIWDMLQYSAIRLKMKDGSYIIPGADKPKGFFNSASTPEHRVDTVYIDRSNTNVICDTVALPPTEDKVKVKAPAFFALKTNLIYDVMLMPNLTAEWYIGKQWSLAVEGNWSWWTFNRPVQNRGYHRIQTVGVEARKWLGSPYPLRGHALGGYAMVGNYDIRLSPEDEYSKAWLSYLSWSAGVSYAYSFPVARKINLEFGLALGYVGGRYYRYDYCMTHEQWTQRAIHNRNYWGPTRVGVSLVWLLSGYNEKKIKR